MQQPTFDKDNVAATQPLEEYLRTNPAAMLKFLDAAECYRQPQRRRFAHDTALVNGQTRL